MADSGLMSSCVGGEADASIVAGVGTAVYYERPGKWHYQSPSLAHKLEQLGTYLTYERADTCCIVWQWDQ